MHLKEFGSFLHSDIFEGESNFAFKEIRFQVKSWSDSLRHLARLAGDFPISINFPVEDSSMDDFFLTRQRRSHWVT